MFHQYRIHSTKSNLLLASIVSLHYWYECNSFKIKSLFLRLPTRSNKTNNSQAKRKEQRRKRQQHTETYNVPTWIYRNFISMNFRFRATRVFWQWMALFPLFVLAKWTSRYTCSKCTLCRHIEIEILKQCTTIFTLSPPLSVCAVHYDSGAHSLSADDVVVDRRRKRARRCVITKLNSFSSGANRKSHFFH